MRTYKCLDCGGEVTWTSKPERCTKFETKEFDMYCGGVMIDKAKYESYEALAELGRMDQEMGLI